MWWQQITYMFTTKLLYVSRMLVSLLSKGASQIFNESKKKTFETNFLFITYWLYLQWCVNLNKKFNLIENFDLIFFLLFFSITTMKSIAIVKSFFKWQPTMRKWNFGRFSNGSRKKKNMRRKRKRNERNNQLQLEFSWFSLTTQCYCNNSKRRKKILLRFAPFFVFAYFAHIK